MATAVMALGSSLRGTESATVEFQAGESMAVHAPDTKMKNSSVAGPPMPANSKAANSAPVAACSASAPRIRRRRSVMSASTPAGSDSRNIGRNTAVCTSAARNEEPVSCSISQAAAMVCMALATKYSEPLRHNARKPAWRSALQVEVGAWGVAAAVLIDGIVGGSRVHVAAGLSRLAPPCTALQTALSLQQRETNPWN